MMSPVCVRRVAVGLGQAEVGDPDAALGVEQQVRRLDVAVDDPLAVGVGQRLGHLDAHAGPRCDRSGAGPPRPRSARTGRAGPPTKRPRCPGRAAPRPSRALSGARSGSAAVPTSNRPVSSERATSAAVPTARFGGAGASRGAGPLAEGLQLAEHHVQRLSLDELHGVEDDPAILADLVDRHDVGVVQPGRGPRLAAEPLQAPGVAGDRVGQDLQGDVPAQRQLLGLVDDAHAAAADLAEDAVVADPLRRARRPARGPRRPGPGGVPGGRGAGVGLLHHDQHREDVADAVGQLRVPVGVLGQRGPLAAAVARDELLGELADRVGRGNSRRSWPDLLPVPRPGR